MKLYRNWKSICKRAWSMRFMAMAALFNAATVVIALYSYHFPELSSIGKVWFSVAAFFFTAAAFASRVVYQDGI